MSDYINQTLLWGCLTLLMCIIVQIIIYMRKMSCDKTITAVTTNTEDNVDFKKEAIEKESQDKTNQSEETTSQENRPTGKQNKKRTNWKGKSDFNHPWLLKSLKGHTGNVLDMDFSSNGKFMATACEDAVRSPTPQRRRRPRDKRRQQPAPPPPPPRLAPDTLAAALAPYVLSPERMMTLGYPLECDSHSNKAIVYVSRPPRARPLTFDVNAPEFIPGVGSSGDSDSGRGSGGSSPRSESDEEADLMELTCARCYSTFRATKDGEYITRERCFYHWGRVGYDRNLSCCGGQVGSRGCDVARLHVWSGTRPGMNGPLEGYVRARTRRGGIYALDTEMCYTSTGLELASVCVVGADGRAVYRATVKPSAPVVDHNTRFSGIRPRDLERATKSLRDVQNDILGFVGCDTILVGHALDNDLRALKLLHNACVDTCALFPHERGLPWRRSLRALSSQLLGRAVQQAAHSPLEDARAALDLALLRVHADVAVS